MIDFGRSSGAFEPTSSLDRSEASDPDSQVAASERTEHDGGKVRRGWDLLAREEPLEIRIAGVPIAVVMRTPGFDEELVLGFLRTEAIIEHRDDVSSVRPCSVADPPEAEGNVVQVTLSDRVELDLARLRRHFFATSSCGVCGKASIEQVLQRTEPLDGQVSVQRSVLLGLPNSLMLQQGAFRETGGLHAAGLFDTGGRGWVVREDVGRHNAVDKVIGWALGEAVDLTRAVLMVSGRVSFEVVQKALTARIPVVAAVSAPTSLAVELARRGRQILVGFVRGQRLCVYSEEERVVD